MSLIAFNLTGSPVVLAASFPTAPTLPASNSPPSRGPGVNVTSELRPDLTVDPANGVAGGLSAANYTAIQAQISANDIELEWTADAEYLSDAVLPGGPVPTLAAGSIPFSDGSGLVEDNANLFWDDANNRLGLGTASPSARLSIAEDQGGASLAGISITGHRSSAPPRPSVSFFAGSGTLAAPADVVADDGLGELIGQGYAGGAFRTVASIAMNVDPGTISATSLPSGIRFRTTPDGSIIRQERMRITSEGNVGIGTTSPATSAKLEIESTTGALLVSRMTTAERDALTAVDGMIVYNITTATMQGRVAAAWVNL